MNVMNIMCGPERVGPYTPSKGNGTLATLPRGGAQALEGFRADMTD
jgi:hypothetical protein